LKANSRISISISMSNSNSSSSEIINYNGQEPAPSTPTAQEPAPSTPAHAWSVFSAGKTPGNASVLSTRPRN
jgi:hypothetical protein